MKTIIYSYPYSALCFDSMYYRIVMLVKLLEAMLACVRLSLILIDSAL